MKLPRQNRDTIERLMLAMRDDPDRAIRGFSLGAISAVAENLGVTATDSMLEEAAACRTWDELEDLGAIIVPIIEARAHLESRQ